MRELTEREGLPHWKSFRAGMALIEEAVQSAPDSRSVNTMVDEIYFWAKQRYDEYWDGIAKQYEAAQEPVNPGIGQWFSNLNWAMQRRVMEVADSEEEMAHVLEYFPLPFRENHAWVFPIKGEVPKGEWTKNDLKAIRAYVKTKPALKREQKRTPWTDLTLEQAGH